MAMFPRPSHLSVYQLQELRYFLHVLIYVAIRGLWEVSQLFCIIQKAIFQHYRRYIAKYSHILSNINFRDSLVFLLLRTCLVQSMLSLKFTIEAFRLDTDE